jgi:hypothetical protein
MRRSYGLSYLHCDVSTVRRWAKNVVALAVQANEHPSLPPIIDNYEAESLLCRESAVHWKSGAGDERRCVRK